MAEINLVGKKLGDYILRDKLTSGGMAEIYLGEDEKLQRRAAIKILEMDVSSEDTVLRERFEREARAVAQLEHDSIVPIYQFGEEGNLYFIAMRYIEGNDLADEMKKYRQRGKKMPPERMLALLEQVASGLDYAHKRGIIHRDVKPSNILLYKRSPGVPDKAVLTDFGLVLWEDVDQTLGTAFGTPRYISPEQATDSQSALPQSDVYSLAVVVYEIVTGKVLFTGNSPMEIALSHITEPPTPPRAHNPDIPQDAQHEILKALQKDPARRHRTASEFINALKQAYDLDDSKPTQPHDDKQPSTKPFHDDESIAAIQTASDVRSWDSIEERPQVSPTITKPEGHAERASQSGKKGGLPLPLIGVGLIAIIILVAAMLILNGGGGEGGIIGNPSSNPNLEIRYNENFFAIANISDNLQITIDSLNVEGASGESSSQNFDNQLNPSDCVFIRRSSVVDSDLPDDWNCDGQAIAVDSAEMIFWRADDSEDTTFTIKRGNSVVSTCDTAGRAVNRAGENMCQITWADVVVLEDEE